jgi:disulfide bond formation protein DsbB
MSRVDLPERGEAYRNGGVALVLALAAILGALAFEHIVGLPPCPLCLQQRYAYYIGIPALFVALVLVAAESSRLAALLFFAVSLVFLANTGLGIYHAGVEWGLWLGPDSCAGGPAELKPVGGSLLQSLEASRVVRCDKSPWNFMGLSLAGWNAVVSFAIFVAALMAALAESRRSR